MISKLLSFTKNLLYAKYHDGSHDQGKNCYFRDVWIQLERWLYNNHNTYNYSYNVLSFYCVPSAVEISLVQVVFTEHSMRWGTIFISILEVSFLQLEKDSAYLAQIHSWAWIFFITSNLQGCSLQSLNILNHLHYAVWMYYNRLGIKGLFTWLWAEGKKALIRPTQVKNSLHLILGWNLVN